MLKFGKISNVDPEKGLARVKFDDDNIVSDWLPVSVRKSLADKETYTFDIDEHVWCIMDDYCEAGVIGGAIYSEKVKAVQPGKDVFALEFKDKTRLEYDRAKNIYSIKINSDVQFIVSKDGYDLKKGDESLKKILSDLLDQLASETHPTGLGPSGVPVNAKDYNKIKNRLSKLFL